MTTASTITVWLPGPGWAEASERAVPRARAIVRDQLARYAAGEPLRHVVGARGY